jgi:hypothetical protein
LAAKNNFPKFLISLFGKVQKILQQGVISAEGQERAGFTEAGMGGESGDDSVTSARDGAINCPMAPA